mgnify:CR=1 FL=1
MNDPIDDAGRADYRCREHDPSEQDLFDAEHEKLTADGCDLLMVELLDDTYNAEDYGTLGQVVRYLVDGEAIVGMSCIDSFLTGEAKARVENKT